MSDPWLARPSRSALEADFDHDPGRFAANQLATQNFSMTSDVHDQVADRLAKITIGPILDLGGGNGTLAKLLSEQVAAPSLLIALTTFAAHPAPRYRPTLRGCRFAPSVSLPSPLYGCCITWTGRRRR